MRICDLAMTSFLKTESVFPRSSNNYQTALCDDTVTIALEVCFKFVTQRMKDGDEWRM